MKNFVFLGDSITDAVVCGSLNTMASETAM